MLSLIPLSPVAVATRIAPAGCSHAHFPLPCHTALRTSLLPGKESGMKCREYQCDYKNVLPYFTTLEENAAQLLQALSQSHRFAFGFEKAILALSLCSRHIKTCHTNWGLFYLLVLLLILQHKTHKRKSPLSQTSPKLTGAYQMLSAVQTQI